MRKKVIFIGAGGYAKSALDSLDSDVLPINVDLLIILNRFILYILAILLLLIQ